MGTVRFILAMLVVYYHIDGVTHFGLPLPDGLTAVQMFYVISGFYMAMILNEKYKSADMDFTFYSNRFFRLWPPMMVVAGLVVVQFVVTNEVMLFNLSLSFGDFIDYLSALDPLFLIYLALTNILIIGQDWVWFFCIDSRGGISYCPLVESPTRKGASFLLNHVTWTVAVEATFYLVSPFLLRRSIAWSAVLCALGFAWHVFVYAAGWNPRLWSYFFVGSAAFFYFLGACTYHGYVRLSRLPQSPPHRARLLARIELPAYLLVLALATVAWLYTPGSRFAMAILLAAVIPLLFQRTKGSAVDRRIGELSFGVYLLHFPLHLLLLDAFDDLSAAALTALLVVPAALLLYVAVEAPIDRWRQRRVRASAPAVRAKRAVASTA